MTNSEASAPSSATAGRPVYIIDGSRTPFLKTRGKPGPFSPVDLAVQCGRPLLMRQKMAPEDFDQVILGCVNVVPNEMNPARVAALRLGMGERMRAFTIQINCGSGMQSVDTAYRYIADGSNDLILAGGAESLSHAPLVLQRQAVDWLAQMQQAKTLQQRLANMARFKLGYLKPAISLKAGLTDPNVGLSMGQTAEIIGHMFNISRAEADAYAVSSHQRLARAWDEGWLDNEVEPAVSADGQIFDKDDGLRRDSSVESLAKLKPVFERPYGRVTAGNSSQVTDGASWIILASAEAVDKFGLEPKAVIRDTQWSALAPEIMGLGPALAGSAILQRQNFGLDDIDLWEINEAFAAQVLACLAAWDDADFCTNILGRDAPLGRLDRNKLNIDGGAISMGHPVGASGNRILLHLMNALERQGLKRGIATQCVGGGQSGATLIEML
jgi:acetyl-CoA C-acetyltransferase